MMEHRKSLRLLTNFYILQILIKKSCFEYDSGVPEAS